jgi:hypothetical protein
MKRRAGDAGDDEEERGANGERQEEHGEHRAPAAFKGAAHGSRIVAIVMIPLPVRFE